FSLRHFAEPQEHFVSGGSNSSVVWAYHASAPSRSKKGSTCLSASKSFSCSPHDSQVKTMRGTPQKRWREMHQSGRSATISRIRASPQEGFHFTFAISVRA